MVNFHDPAVIAKDLLALQRLNLVTDGIYIWEFFTTLDYEFNIIRGRRPYRWTIWIYSLARIASLLDVVLDLIYINSTTPINCQVWVTLQMMAGYLGLVVASFLIVIRIIAIWNRDKIVMAIAASVWFTNVAVSIRVVVQLRSYWKTVTQHCVVSNSESSKLNLIVLGITDIVLLFILLVGLLRFRKDGGGTFGIGLLLWKQGVWWLFLAAAAEVPPVVLIILNLNPPLNLIFQLPLSITMSIAATRMYRSLSDFLSGVAESTSRVSKLHWNQTPFNRVEVIVDTS